MLRCMMIEVKEICRYPVKGLAADCLQTVTLSPGQALPYDRRWGIIHAASQVDPAAPEWAPKQNFLMLARDPRLAKLGLEFDEETTALTITRKGRPVSRGVMSDHIGRQTLQTFLAGFMPRGARGMPRIVEAPSGDSFSDVSSNYVSIINLASVADLEERVIRQKVHPHRFRGNLYLAGLQSWEEKDWVGKTLTIGDVELEIVKLIERCAATNANPESGEVDMNIPLSLRRGFGYIDMGVYGRVVKGGEISVGDAATLS